MLGNVTTDRYFQTVKHSYTSNVNEKFLSQFSFVIEFSVLYSTSPSIKGMALIFEPDKCVVFLLQRLGIIIPTNDENIL